MIIRCPACGFSGRVPEGKDRRDRKRVVCPSCGHRFDVGMVVLPPEGRPPGASERTAAGGPANGATAGAAPPSGRVKRKWRHPFAWGCLIALAVIAIAIASVIVFNGVSRRIQESKDYDILTKLGEKYPGYLLLTSIATDNGSMTKVQLNSYQEGLVGKGCVGMGKVLNTEKTVGSTVLDFFGLTAPGTIITLTHERYDIELVLDDSYSDEFLTYSVGDMVLFAGTIKKVVVAGRTRVILVDVIIERHQKYQTQGEVPDKDGADPGDFRTRFWRQILKFGQEWL